MRTPLSRPSAAPLVGLLALCLTVSGSAQVYAPAESVTVVPRAGYKAGGLHRMFFGDHYRQLWTTAIRVPVLNLARFAGGLKPTQRGGGQQTKSLRLQGADGTSSARSPRIPGSFSRPSFEAPSPIGSSRTR